MASHAHVSLTDEEEELTAPTVLTRTTHLWDKSRVHVVCQVPVLSDEFEGRTSHLHFMIVWFFLASIGQQLHMGRELGIPAVHFRNM